MFGQTHSARAFFLRPGGASLPDHAVCSGQTDARLQGEVCPFSDSGHLPLGGDPSNDRVAKADLGQAPACAVERLGPIVGLAGGNARARSAGCLAGANGHQMSANVPAGDARRIRFWVRESGRPG
jgi:hypothetical protein